MNEPLQRRAGNNIGVSPCSALPLYQQHVNAPMLTLEDGDTVLWEPVPGCIRVPGGSKPVFPGILLTDDLALGNIDVAIIFIDSTGREFQIGDGFMASGDGIGILTIDGFASGKLGSTPFGLCSEAGEQIVARVTGATLPNGKVKVVPYSKDWKVKGAGKGGLSDGGTRCLRGVVTSTGVDFQPRPGTCWEPVDVTGQVSGGGGFFSLICSNADAVETALVQVCVVAPDGTEYPINTPAEYGNFEIIPEALAGFIEFFGGDSINQEIRGYIQYPTKLRVKFAPGNTATGRVEAMLLVAENDVAKDLVQEAS